MDNLLCMMLHKVNIIFKLLYDNVTKSGVTHLLNAMQQCERLISVGERFVLKDA